MQTAISNSYRLESEKQKTEKVRQDAVTVKQKAESKKQKTEKVRQDALTIKQEVESEKQKLESKKQNIEEIRQDALTVKQEIEAGKQILESEKQKVEKIRQDALTIKQEIESEKQILESERQKVEKIRQDTLTIKQEAESEKQKLESKKQETEKVRQDAVTIKQEVESERQRIGNLQLEIEREKEKLKEKEQELLRLYNIELESKNKELENINRELARFTYIASHDLQEPLNNIISFSGLLKKKYYDKLEGIGQQSVEIIEKSTLRMKSLIVGLLEYSHIGKKTELQAVNVNEILEDIKMDIASLLQERQVEFKYDDLLVIAGYKDELRMLMLNLITNAIKYCKETPVIHIKAEETSTQYKYFVVDNGIGIDMQYKDRIFEIFKRLHTIDQYSGTGIGLANCSRIVELHKGKIWVQSEENKGSTFIFTIKKGLKDE